MNLNTDETDDASVDPNSAIFNLWLEVSLKCWEGHTGPKSHPALVQWFYEQEALDSRWRRLEQAYGEYKATVVESPKP